MPYVDDQLAHIERLAQELEETLRRHKLEVEAIKESLEIAAARALHNSPTPDETREIASQVYWNYEVIPTRVIYDFYKTTPQGVAKLLYQATARVKCYDCHQIFDLVLKSRSKQKDMRRDPVGVCPDCQRQRDMHSAGLSEMWAQQEAAIKELARMPYAQYLQTEHWQETRRAALKRAGFKCQLCNSGGVLDVHHRTYERRGQERSADVIVLCRDCHSKFHDKEV